MKRLLTGSTRWMRLLVALVLLLNGAGVHELLHERSEGAAESPASGCIEAHAGDCQHRQDVDAPHEHTCLLCKLGPTHEAPSPAFGNGQDLLPARRLDSLPRAVHAPAACIPGELGARGPPARRA